MQFKIFIIIICEGVWTLEEDVHQGLVICILTENSELPVSPAYPAMSREIRLNALQKFLLTSTTLWLKDCKMRGNYLLPRDMKLHEADSYFHLRF